MKTLDVQYLTQIGKVAYKILKNSQITLEILDDFVREILRLLPNRISEIINQKRYQNPRQLHIYPKRTMRRKKKQSRKDRDQYSLVPFTQPYSKRKIHFLRYCARHKFKYPNLIPHLARYALGRRVHIANRLINRYIKRLDERLDCTDFFMPHILLGFLLEQKRAEMISDDRIKTQKIKFFTNLQKNRLKKAILRFKYWIDEPRASRMIFWTENHQILFHAIEYLAGQLFPNDLFLNDNHVGKWHQKHGKKHALQWMEYRARWNFFEWSSSEYYAMDLPALILLAEFAQDHEISHKAQYLINLMLTSVASDLFYGNFASTHGRAYENEILSGWDFDMAPVCKLIWGMGTFGKEGASAAICLALAQSYNPPPAIIKLGQLQSESLLTYEQHGLKLNQAEQYGISMDNIKNLPFFWGLGAYTNQDILDLLIQGAEEWNLWEYPFFNLLGPLHKIIPSDVLINPMLKNLEIESNRILLGNANKITYRNSYYMLSSVQNYRPGEAGNQHHIWQATLSQDAHVFTKNPGSIGGRDPRRTPHKLRFSKKEMNAPMSAENRTPTYWAGENRLPKVAQFENIAFILYNIDTRPLLGERGVFEYTHAFFPVWAFDEVRVGQNHQINLNSLSNKSNFDKKDSLQSLPKINRKKPLSFHWVFGRCNESYIALYSYQSLKWVDHGLPFQHDLRADGIKNIWVCHLGDAIEYGTFSKFIKIITNNTLTVNINSLQVQYTTMHRGLFQFSWEGDFYHNKQQVSLENFPLIHNKFVHGEYNQGTFFIDINGQKTHFDFYNP